MGVDEDIAASLPRPPQPAPARRTAAIEQALRRFDGVGGSAEAPAGPARAGRSTAWLSPSGRRYAGAIASVALVVLIGVPLALDSTRERAVFEDRAPAAATAMETQSDPVVAAADAGPSAPVIDSRAAAPEAQSGPAPAAEAVADAAPAPDRIVFAEAAPPVPVTPVDRTADARAAARSGEAGVSSASEPVVITGSRIRRPALTAPVQALKDESEDAAIVVTSSSVAPRGDWNACTVDDPSPSLSGCRHLVDPAARGARGQAASHLADGLTLAWRGELDDAIAAFDRAIAIAPESSFAYLNRGQAHRRKGDLGRALADLDRAVEQAPRAARGYYHRSLVLRQLDAPDRALADERRALSIDPGYAAILR